jgi:uncharacterized membrane protein/predicted heme/steroid binding protein
MESLFLQIAGLPLHPLVVHAAVVVIPLAAVMLVVGIVFYRRMPKLLGVGAIVTWIAAGAAFVATQSGEALAEEIGITATHEQWGELATPATIAMAVIATATWFIRRRRWRALSLAGTAATLIAAPLLLILVFLVGHSGAEATWGGRLQSVATDNQATVVPPSTELPAPSEASVAPVVASGFTLDEVAQHATVDDCWVAVDGIVYDLSGYSTSHPGGASRIEGICGTDATSAFRTQHGTQGSPNRTLAGFEIGLLK